MAEEGEDRCVVAQVKVPIGLKLPNFNWKANNMRVEFEIFKQTLAFIENDIEIPKDKWYLYILQ